MHLTKADVWRLADELGYLDFVQQKTHTCYLGIDGGCHQCPACLLREAGWKEYQQLKEPKR
jgi:7-cyano-7-deazaguanine synthase